MTQRAQIRVHPKVEPTVVPERVGVAPTLALYVVAAATLMDSEEMPWAPWSLWATAQLHFS